MKYVALFSTTGHLYPLNQNVIILFLSSVFHSLHAVTSANSSKFSSQPLHFLFFFSVHHPQTEHTYNKSYATFANANVQFKTNCSLPSGTIQDYPPPPRLDTEWQNPLECSFPSCRTTAISRDAPNQKKPQTWALRLTHPLSKNVYSCYKSFLNLLYGKQFHM